MVAARRPPSSPSGSAVTAAADAATLVAKPPSPAETSTRWAGHEPAHRLADQGHAPGGLGPRHEGDGRLDLVLPPDERRVHVVDARRLHVDDDVAGSRHRVGGAPPPAAATADRARCRRRRAHGHARYRRLRRGPHPGRCGPTSSHCSRRSRRPPTPCSSGSASGHCRDRATSRTWPRRSSCWWTTTGRPGSPASTKLAGGAHLEQLSVQPDRGGRGTGAPLSAPPAPGQGGTTATPSSRSPRIATCPGTGRSTRRRASSRSVRSTSGTPLGAFRPRSPCAPLRHAGAHGAPVVSSA